MEITAALVKELREATGAGMMDCKKALVEANGDMEAAIDILRTKGLAALAKKSGRATNEGVIGGFTNADSTVGVLVEVNCETDFVARNANFKSLVTQVAGQIATGGADDVATLMSQPFAERPEITMQELLGEAVGKLGENMGVTRFVRYELSTDTGLITFYIHGVGNIGVLVEVAAASDECAASDAARTFAKDVAMQIAAAAPIAVSREEVSAEVIEHEMAIYKAQAAETGKPEAIQQKIAEGRLDKFYKEVCLLEQPFVKNPDLTVKQYAGECSKAAGATIEVTRFVRMVLGETAKEPKTSCE